jgi:hypothetical protein
MYFFSFSFLMIVPSGLSINFVLGVAADACGGANRHGKERRKGKGI